MPLIGKTPFARQSPPPELQPDDYVFFCKTTGEVFCDYEKFFDQSILCNSVIWTCAITGKSELTFQEAVESEKKALKVVVFPSYLQRPLLFLVSQTFRRNVGDVTDDIYYFAKKRFFIGEAVEVVISGEKKCGIVKRIFFNDPDCPLTNGDCKNSEADGSEATSAVENMILPHKYEIEDAETGTVVVVDAANISRKKGIITKEKCHLFIKQHCLLSNEGVWAIKDKFLKKFKLDEAKFTDFFSGPVPAFEKSPRKKPIVNQNKMSDDDEDDFETEKDRRKSKENQKSRKEQENEDEKAVLAKTKERERQQKREELKRKAEEEKEKKREEKHKKKEEKKEHEMYLREWNKPRDDLCCEDLKDLPASIPVTCLSEGFGDAMMVLEYLHSFRDSFGIDLPTNFSIVTFCQSITESKVEGLFGSLLQQLLQAIFQMELDNDDKQQVFGIPLKKLQLDSYSLTEILRMYFTRGWVEESSGDGNTDEITSEFFQQHPSIVHILAKRTVFDLSAGDKLNILSALVNQLLAFHTSRGIIEENYEQFKMAQRLLRIHQISMQKRERDEIQYNSRKKFEEKMKEQSASSEMGESSNLANGKSSANDLHKGEGTRRTRKKKSITDLCEKDFENMPVENIDWDQLSIEEKKCIKEWSLKKKKVPTATLR